MQTNETNIVVVTDKLNAFIGLSDMRVRKIEGTSLDIFSDLKDFVEENSRENK
jgi:hypothetical protein